MSYYPDPIYDIEKSSYSFITRSGMMVYDDGTIRYYESGDLCNTRGPAVEHTDGRVEWWIAGRKYTFETWVKHRKAANCLSDEDETLLKLEYG